MKKNLITSLKKLLKAFGGDDESVKNNAVDIIDKIADNVSGSGSGGHGVLVLHATGTDGRYYLDKTYAEIKSAMQSGGCVVENSGNVVAVTKCALEKGVYFVGLVDSIKLDTSEVTNFSAESISDYPSFAGK